MTKEEAIATLTLIKGSKSGCVVVNLNKAINMAISALSAEHEEADGVITIEKQSAKDVGKIKHIVIGSPNYTRYFYNESMPISAETVTHEIRTETHDSDLISRKNAVEEIDKEMDMADNCVGAFFEGKFNGLYEAKKIIKKAPSVSTDRLGEWIDHSEDGYVECPFCEHATNCDGNIEELHYCFWCGAKMKGGAE